MLSNNHVGNEWDDEVYYNGKEVYKFEITAPYNQKYITLYSVVTEEDNIPDTGYGQLTILLKDGNTKKTKIYVTENRGRYSGRKGGKFRIMMDLSNLKAGITRFFQKNERTLKCENGSGMISV
jgi:hypothetical protein